VDTTLGLVVEGAQEPLPQPGAAAPPPRPAAGPPPRPAAAPPPARSQPTPGPAGPATLVVSGQGQGQYRTIGEALRAAPPHARVLVRPGFYREKLLLKKPVELAGDGPLQQIVVESSETTCVEVEVAGVTVRGLTLQCVRADSVIVLIRKRQALLEGCDIVGGRDGIVLAQDRLKEVSIRRCLVRGASGAGLAVSGKGSEPLVEECQFVNAAGCGVFAHESAPVLKRCTVQGNGKGGLLWTASSKGLIEDCNIAGNAPLGVHILQESNPTVRECRILSNQGHGVQIESSKGIIEDCTIGQNAGAGVLIAPFSQPVIRRCKIQGNQQTGVWGWPEGRGSVEKCTLTGNRGGAWQIDAGNLTQRRGNKER
jgi:nitrous oxidase accessory protein NosD